MTRNWILIGAAVCSVLLGCGDIVGGPLRIRPIVRVDARFLVGGLKTKRVTVGEVARLNFVVYSSADSGSDVGAVCTPRNASIGTVVEQGVTGRSAGFTYVVGEVIDNGVAFRDSVALTVGP